MPKPTVYLFIALSTLFSGSYVAAQTAPDNSKSNQVDPTNAAATSDSQSNSAADVSLTKRIRQSLMADKSLSTYAHNVKIISANGNVTLNGVVRTEEEKSMIATKAEDVAGKGRVTNNLKISPSN